ncbi:unnamed protein product, partial [Prorocentrum cordatum]
MATPPNEDIVNRISTLLTSALLPYRDELAGRRDIDALVKHRELIVAVKDWAVVVVTLVFVFLFLILHLPNKDAGNKGELKILFQKVAENRNSEWQLGREAEAWATKMGRRAQAMRRDIQQAITKARDGDNVPEWLSPFMQDGTDKTEYDVKYIRDEQVCYRTQKGVKKPLREESEPLQPNDEGDDELVLAKWHDGFTRRIPNLTNKTLRALQVDNGSGDRRPSSVTEIKREVAKDGATWRLIDAKERRPDVPDVAFLRIFRVQGAAKPTLQLVVTRHTADEKEK